MNNNNYIHHSKRRRGTGGQSMHKEEHGSGTLILSEPQLQPQCIHPVKIVPATRAHLWGTGRTPNDTPMHTSHTWRFLSLTQARTPHSLLPSHSTMHTCLIPLSLLISYSRTHLTPSSLSLQHTHFPHFFPLPSEYTLHSLLPSCSSLTLACTPDSLHTGYVFSSHILSPTSSSL